MLFKLNRKASYLEVLKIAWPLVIANSFWNIQLTVDRIFLGQYSTEALAAAMGVTGIFWAFMAFLQQTAAYVTTFVAQYKGAKELQFIGPIVWQSFYFSVVCGLLFLLFIPFSDEIFRWFDHPKNVQANESLYFQALCYSALPTAFVAAISGYFTGLGDSKKIIWINASAMLANIVLDYLFIFGNFGFPELGIEGAGYATSLATYIAVILGLYLVATSKNRERHCLLKGWKFDLNLTKRFLKFGAPSGVQWMIEGLAFTVFLIFIGQMPHGEAALASSGIAVTVMLLAVLPAIGIAQAASVLVGQHLGEKQPSLAERATYSGFHLAILYIFVAAMSFLFFPDLYINLFENNSKPLVWDHIQTMTAVLLVFVAIFTHFDSANFVFSFALKGAGDTRFVSLVSLLVPWPLMVIPTYFVRDIDQGLYYAWLFASLFIMTQACIFYFRFRSGGWKKLSVIQ